MAVTKDDLFFHEVRALQRRTRCSNFVCEEFVRAYRKLSPTPLEKSFREFDKNAKSAAGCNYIILNGCPQCNRHVYLPADKARRCPFVRKDGNVCGHPRFNAQKKPFEVSVLFARSRTFFCRTYNCLCVFVLFELFYLLFACLHSKTTWFILHGNFCGHKTLEVSVLFARELYFVALTIAYAYLFCLNYILFVLFMLFIIRLLVYFYILKLHVFFAQIEGILLFYPRAVESTVADTGLPRALGV